MTDDRSFHTAFSHAKSSLPKRLSVHSQRSLKENDNSIFTGSQTIEYATKLRTWNSIEEMDLDKEVNEVSEPTLNLTDLVPQNELAEASDDTCAGERRQNIQSLQSYLYQASASQEPDQTHGSLSHLNRSTISGPSNLSATCEDLYNQLFRQVREQLQEMHEPK